MSATLVLKCAVPAFAVVGAGTVWMVDGPVAAGFTLGAFLLGVLTSELHHMRWTAVDTAGAQSDSALLALLDVEAGRAAEAPALAAVPPAPPRRNFRCTSDALAIGSALDRSALADRRLRHRERASRDQAEAQVPMSEPVPAAPSLAELLEADSAAPEEPVRLVANGRPPEPPPPSVMIFKTPRARSAAG